MQRLNKENINTPQWFNERFDNKLAVADMERLEKLAENFTGGVYVDVGCWDSIMPVILSERYPKSKIYALDFADRVISFLSPRFPKVKYQTIETCYKLPFEDNSVDCVVAGELIEHLDEPQVFVNEALRVLKPGGYLSISTPHSEAEKLHHIGGPIHVWSFDENDLRQLGFTTIEVVKEGNFLTWIAHQKKV